LRVSLIHRPIAWTRRFVRDENGSITILTLFLVIMMLIIAGTCVDFMRHETARSRLQATSDRAVLAASDLQQVYTSDWDAEDVVRDYFAKAGLLDRLKSVQVTESVNSRSVTARALIGLDTIFMRLAGVNTLVAPASGAAQESANDIEIVLVLDVSGSMRDSSKIQNLRTAASEFVRDMLDEDEEHRISIAVVPFNAQVNLGPTLFNAMVAEGYNITNQHGVTNSYCIDTPADAFAIPGYDFAPPLASRLALPQAAHADGVATTTRNTSYVAIQGPDESPDGNMPCRRDTRNFVRPPSQDIAQLQGWIRNLDARGNTSITRGMDIGLMLLDPSSRSLYSRLIGSRDVPATLSGRPYDFGRANTMKVIVVMTDGDHVSSTYVEDAYKTGTSPIWKADDGRYSIFHESRLSSDNPTERCAPFWVPHYTNNQGQGNQGQWHVRPWNGSATGATTGCYDPSATYTNTTRQSWQQVWGTARVSWVAWQLYARALGTSNNNRNSIYDTWVANFTGQTNEGNMDTTLQQSCTLAKQRGVVVYGIALTAPANGQAQISKCSSSPSHYFYTTSSTLGTTFSAIAAHINALRLTQ
jgi:Flp pilus assembly protein TadG